MAWSILDGFSLQIFVSLFVASIGAAPETNGVMQSGSSKRVLCNRGIRFAAKLWKARNLDFRVGKWAQPSDMKCKLEVVFLFVAKNVLPMIADFPSF